MVDVAEIEVRTMVPCSVVRWRSLFAGLSDGCIFRCHSAAGTTGGAVSSHRGGQFEQVVGCAQQAPLPRDLLKAAEQELAELRV